MGCNSGCSSVPANAGASGPLAWFAGMIDHCYDHAEAAKAAGRPVVGILCEFTPRELILAAGAVPVCLCGGSAATIPAAEEYLPANLCPLIKSTFGYLVLKKNPFLEWADLVVAETTCDGKKKMFELLYISLAPDFKHSQTNENPGQHSPLYCNSAGSSSCCLNGGENRRQVGAAGHNFEKWEYAKSE